MNTDFTIAEWLAEHGRIKRAIEDLEAQLRCAEAVGLAAVSDRTRLDACKASWDSADARARKLRWLR